MFYDRVPHATEVFRRTAAAGRRAGPASNPPALLEWNRAMSELRISLRRLLRSPGYITAAVLSLAIGTAVCVAAFSLVNVMVFEDVPGIHDRRSLVRINWTTQGGRFTSAELDALERLRPPALGSLAAQGDRSLPVLLPSGPETLTVALVSAQFFETLGTRAVMGRLLTAVDAAPGAPPAAVVADDLWRRCLQQRPGYRRTIDRGGRARVHHCRCHAGPHAGASPGGPRLAGCDAAAGVGRPRSRGRLAERLP